MSSKTLKGIFFLFLFCMNLSVLFAEEKIIIYKWRFNGSDICSQDMSATSATKRKYKQAGYWVASFDKEKNLIIDSAMIKTWKEAGNPMIFYTIEDFLEGQAEYKKNLTEKGETWEISSLGSNFYGDVKNGINCSTGAIQFVPKFTGSTTWYSISNLGRISLGHAKMGLNADIKKTDAVNAMSFTNVNSTSMTLAGLKTKLAFLDDPAFLNILFNSKPGEYRKIETWKSKYSNSVSTGGLFKWLAVGTEEKYYVFPENDGQEGELLRTDGKGNLYWGTLGSRDEYLLNRANHYGFQDAATISNFKEAVIAILSGKLPQEVINNFNNNIDIAKLIELIEQYLDEHDTDIFSDNIDPTVIINNMTAEDIAALVEKLKKDPAFMDLFNYDNQKVAALLKGIAVYMSSGDSSGLFYEAITKNIDPTPIISNMDATDITALAAKLGLVKNNYTATVPPVVSNDSKQGYAKGSMWLDLTTKKVYVCADATAGVALWVSLTSSSSGTVNASDVVGLTEFIGNNEKLKKITVTKDVNLDKLNQFVIDTSDTANLTNMKEAITIILNYMHDNMGAPKLYEPADMNATK